MCMYCERRTDVIYGWKQPCLPNVHGNIINTEDSKTEKGVDDVVIHDYRTSTPELIIQLIQLGKEIWGDGVGTIYIPINYCPMCGRKLGRKDEEI